MTQDPIGTPRRVASLMTSTTTAPPVGRRSTAGSIWRMPSPFASSGTDGNSHGNGNTVRGGPHNSHIQSLWDRFTFLKNTDGVRNELLEEVLTRYSELSLTFDELKRQNQQPSAEPSLKTERDAYKEHCEKLCQVLNRDAFATILLDGDSMIFHSDFLRLGEVGGRKAAHQLRIQATEYLETFSDLPSPLRIAARIYANVSGLAHTCVRAGIVNSPTVVEDFVRGFTRGNDLFDFIDVGAGKGRADEKIKAHFIHEIYDYQCRHIVFGCSHESGFVRQLEKFLNENATLRKVTLLEGVPFENELASLPYQTTKFEGLFRDTKIQLNGLDLMDFRGRLDSKGSVFNPNSAVFTPPQSQTPAPVTPPLFSPKSGIPNGVANGVTNGSDAFAPLRNLTRNSSLSSVALSEAPAAGGAPSGLGWANIAKASAQLPYKDLTKKTVEAEAQLTAGTGILLNSQDQRIDKAMDYDHNKVYELKQHKLCNQHYIGRGCCHYEAGNRNCPHRHDMKLNSEDLKWLRVVARETVCKKGTACRELGCIYGHHCPYPKLPDGPRKGVDCINGASCRFHKDMHGMDMKVAKTVQESEDHLIDI